MTDLTTFHARVRRGLDYRVKALLSTHYYGNQQPWQRWVRRRRFRNCMLDLPRREPELAALLRRGMEITNRDPDRPNSRHSDALFLLDTVMRLRPARVLDLPALDFDFIYVDGPQVRQGHYEALVRVGKGAGVPAFLDHKPFDCDALNVAIDRQRSVTFAIDQRIDTRWQIQRLLDRPYRSAYHFAPRKSVFAVTSAATRHIRRTRLDTPSP